MPLTPGLIVGHGTAGVEVSLTTSVLGRSVFRGVLVWILEVTAIVRAVLATHVIVVGSARLAACERIYFIHISFETEKLVSTIEEKFMFLGVWV